MMDMLKTVYLTKTSFCRDIKSLSCWVKQGVAKKQVFFSPFIRANQTAGIKEKMLISNAY